MNNLATADQMYLERQEMAARANAVVTIAKNSHSKNIAIYAPKQAQFKAWAVDPALGKYTNAAVNEEKIVRYITEMHLVTDSAGNILHGRPCAKRGATKRTVAGQTIPNIDDEDDEEEFDNASDLGDVVDDPTVDRQSQYPHFDCPYCDSSYELPYELQQKDLNGSEAPTGISLESLNF